MYYKTYMGVQNRFILHQPFSVNRSFSFFSPKRLNLRAVSSFFFHWIASNTTVATAAAAWCSVGVAV